MQVPAIIHLSQLEDLTGFSSRTCVLYHPIKLFY